MEVFVSWSGERSRQAAVILRDWLPRVLQAIQVWMSEDDIGKGTRWSKEIFRKLDECRFGILCVTRENLSAPFLHFEAGAISKSVPGSMEEGRVTPLLFGVGPADLPGALSQFQATQFAREDVRRLVQTLNEAGGPLLKSDAFEDTFNMWWPELEQRMTTVMEALVGPDERQQLTRDEQILVQVLESTRTNERAILRLEDQLRLLTETTRRARFTPATLPELVVAWRERILPALRPAVKAYLAPSRVLEVSEDAILLGLPDPVLVKRAERIIGEAEAALSHYIGRSVTLKLTLDPQAIPRRGSLFEPEGHPASDPLEEPF